MQEVANKLSQEWDSMQSLLKWLKSAEQKAKDLCTLANNTAGLKEQQKKLKVLTNLMLFVRICCSVQMLTDDVDKHSVKVKAIEDGNDQFIQMSKVLKNMISSFYRWY